MTAAAPVRLPSRAAGWHSTDDPEPTDAAGDVVVLMLNGHQLAGVLVERHPRLQVLDDAGRLWDVEHSAVAAIGTRTTAEPTPAA